MRKALILWIGLLLVPSLSAAQQKADPSWEQTRRIAETQHEIIAVAIRQNNFSQVMPEMRKIFELQFPLKYESTLSQEIEMVADALMHKQQFDLSHQCIDEGLKRLTDNKNKARILQKKAYILVKQGKEDEALRYFRQAVELNKSSNAQ